MKNLLESAKNFSKDVYKKNEKLYKELSQKQNPHTLFIACSDSRVVPSLLTKSLPGELFVIRNIGNIVPPNKKSHDYLSTTSAIEYAVKALEVKNIVICGHSNCGGCKALYYEEELNNMQQTKEWIELVKPLKDKIKNKKDDFNYEEDHELLERENVVMQIKNLLTYPFIEERYNNNSLNIYGWYYNIGTGEIFNYNNFKKVFEKI